MSSYSSEDFPMGHDRNCAACSALCLHPPPEINEQNAEKPAKKRVMVTSIVLQGVAPTVPLNSQIVMRIPI